MIPQYLFILLLALELVPLPALAEGGWPTKGSAAFKLALAACIAARETNDTKEIERRISDGYQRALRSGTSKADLDWALGPKGEKLVDALLTNLARNPKCTGDSDEILRILEDNSFYISISPDLFASPFKKSPDAFRIWLNTNTKAKWSGYRSVVFSDLSDCRRSGSGFDGSNLYICDSAYATFTSPLGSQVCSLYDLAWSGPYLTVDPNTGQRTRVVQGGGPSFTKLTCRWLHDSRFKK